MTLRLRTLLFIGAYAVILILAIALGKFLFTIGFILMSIDKLILSWNAVKRDLGVEIISLPAALIGVELGGLFGFIFTLAMIPLLDVIGWALRLPHSSINPPFFINLDLLVFPLVSLTAAYLSTMFSPLMAAFMAIGIREIFIFLKEIVHGSYGFVVLRGLNILLDLLILYGISTLLT